LAAQEDVSCYSQWAKAFEVRGADEVKDGWHEGVVLSIRRGSRTTCYSAKVQVEKGLVKDVFIKYVDGKYEAYLPKWKYEDSKFTITNGISRTMQTSDDELVNVIFINHLKPKKTAYELAPLPNLDDF
jgi:hypothetical protein